MRELGSALVVGMRIVDLWILLVNGVTVGTVALKDLGNIVGHTQLDSVGNLIELDVVPDVMERAMWFACSLANSVLLDVIQHFKGVD
jgi:hypothetical protein